MHRQLTYDDERNDFEERLTYIKANKNPLSLILDSLDDTRNIGSIFRLADAANLEHIYFYNCSITPTDKRLKKTSRSTHKYVPASLIDFSTIENLKKTHQIVALEITSNSIPYTDLIVQSPTVLIIGSENHGVSEDLLHLIDYSIHIPMLGINTSMNVASAVAISTFHIIQQL